MDHSQQSFQALNESLRLAVLDATPHGVARVVLLYHRILYRTVQTFLLCAVCQQRGALPEEVKRNAATLDEQRRYYTAHIVQFGKPELHGLVKDSLTSIDLSLLCASCLAAFQQQLATTFGESVAQQRVRYHVRRKKRSVPATWQERSGY